MRWVVELPGPSGGTAATVTVDAESWLGALNKARGGIALARYHAEIDDDGTVRVLDRNTRDRFTVRQMKSHAPERPTSSAPPPEPPRPSTPPAEAPLSFGAPSDAPLFFGSEAPAAGLFSDSQSPPASQPEAQADKAGVVGHSSVTVLKGDGTQQPVSVTSKSTLGPGVQASTTAAMTSTPARAAGPESPRPSTPPAQSPPVKSATTSQSEKATTARGHVPPSAALVAQALDDSAPRSAPPPAPSATTGKQPEPAKSTSAKAEPPKAGSSKPEAPKPEAPKPEAPKPEAPKPEAPKPEAPKPEAPKPEAPKPEAPKPEAPKGDVDDDAGIVVEDVVLQGLNGATQDNTRSDTMVVPTIVGGDEPVEALPVPTVLYERDDDPSSGSPITYRERVFAVAEGTPPARAEALARQAFASIKRSLVTRARGRFVTIAVFDHEFDAHPKRPPLVVLQWKDWRGDVVVEFPPSDAPISVAPAVVSVPPAAVVATATAPVGKAPTPPTKPVPQAPAPPAKALEPREKKLSKNKRKRARTNSEARIPSAAVTAAVTPATATPAAATTAERDMPTVVVPVFVAPDAPAVKAAPAAETKPAAEPVAAVTEAAPVASAPAASDKAPEVAAEKPADKPAEVVAEKPAEKPAEKAPEVAAEKPAGKPADKPAEKAPEGVAKKATDSVGEKAADKAHEGTRSVALTGRRRRGKDLVSDLFDALMDLSFAQSSEDACAFAARVIRDTVLVDACTVSLYDIDRDEFTVAATEGGPAAGTRVKAKGGHRAVAVRKHASVNVKVCEPSEAFAPSFMGAPALFSASYHRERLFAMIVIQRMRGGPVFESDEEDGVNYVASQLAEALSTHSRRAAAAEYSDQKPGAGSPPAKRR